MRIIKFRAFHKNEKKMYKVFSFCHAFVKIEVGIGTASEKIPINLFDPLMQFTGLKDQGGKGQDIYEGDYFQTDKKWFVEWQEDLCRFVLTTGNGYDSKNCVDLTCDEVYYLKIAGNKYENKD